MSNPILGEKQRKYLQFMIYRIQFLIKEYTERYTWKDKQWIFREGEGLNTY